MSSTTAHLGTVLIAVGGNALVLDGEAGSVDRQLERAADFAESIAELVASGWTAIVTHGNGPQVGYILRRGELVAPDATVEGLPALPLWLAVADSQGGIGHMLAIAIDTAMQRRGLVTRAVAVLTHAEVDAKDPAFTKPTKPIGGQLSADVARRRAAEEGWVVTEIAEDNYRRVVASPLPLAIIESEQIRVLVNSGAIVIAAGGGGIPVVRDTQGWHAVDAVIDKDRASALLAREIDVATLVLVTGVDEVYVDFNKPDQRALHNVDIDEMRGYLAAGQFPPGSMGPKVQSAIDFVAKAGGRAIITSIGKLADALAGNAGTVVNAGGRMPPAP
ncbi:MAG: carbamate kinase [Lacisediminihabitans sp.]